MLQLDIFEDRAQTTSLTHLMLGEILEAGPRKLKDALNDLNRLLKQASESDSLFGASTKEDILKDVLEQNCYNIDKLRKAYEQRRQATRQATEGAVDGGHPGREDTAGRANGADTGTKDQTPESPSSLSGVEEAEGEVTPDLPKGENPVPHAAVPQPPKTQSPNPPKTSDPALTPSTPAEKEAVNTALSTLDTEIREQEERVRSAKAALEKATAKESGNRDLFGEDDAVTPQNSLFTNSEMGFDNSDQGIVNRTQKQRSDLAKEQQALDDLKSEATRNSRIRAAIANVRNQTHLDFQKATSPSTNEVPRAEAQPQPSPSPRRSPVSVALRSALERILNCKGLLGDWEEGQDIISRWEELVQMSRKKKSASETVVPGEDSPFKATAVSKTDVAKIENNLEALVKESENLSKRNKKSFMGRLADAIDAKNEGSASKYAVIETKNGEVVTIRLADHNATISNFDHKERDNGISIVISRKPNEGLTNDGDAHIVEFFYSDKALKKAEGNPYSQIARSMQQVLYSGEYKDTTGLAVREEVNVPKFYRTSTGEVYGFAYKGKIYIDPRIAGADTPIHEYTHLWADAMKLANPKTWQRIVGIMEKQTKLWNDIAKQYPELEDKDTLAAEVLAHYSGSKGAQRLQKLIDETDMSDASLYAQTVAAVHRMQKVLDTFWRAVAEKIGFRFSNAQTVADTILKDLLDENHTLASPATVRRDSVAPEMQEVQKRDTFYSNAQRVLEGPFKGVTWTVSWKLKNGLKLEPKEKAALKAAGIPYESYRKGTAVTTKAQNPKTLSRLAPIEPSKPSTTPSEYSEYSKKSPSKNSRKATVAKAMGKIFGLDIDIIDNDANLTGDQARAKGWYDTETGKIAVVLPKNNGIADTVRTILHESVAHHGLRKLFGDNLDTFLQAIYDNAPQEIRDAIRQHYLETTQTLEAPTSRNNEITESRHHDITTSRHSDITTSRHSDTPPSQNPATVSGDFVTATEEYMASIAEDIASPTILWDIARHHFHNMLRKAGIDIGTGITNGDIRYLLWRSAKNLLNEKNANQIYYANLRRTADAYQYQRARLRPHWMFERSPSLLMGWRKKGKVTAKANLFVARRTICKSMCNFAFEWYIQRI